MLQNREKKSDPPRTFPAILRSAVGKTHVLRSRPVMNYTTSHFPLIVLWLYSEIDHLLLSSEAQCVSHLLPPPPPSDCHKKSFICSTTANICSLLAGHWHLCDTHSHYQCVFIQVAFTHFTWVAQRELDWTLTTWDRILAWRGAIKLKWESRMYNSPAAGH